MIAFVQSGSLFVGEPFLAAAQDESDAVERVALAAEVAVDVLLQATAALIDGVGAELDDVERIIPMSG